MEIQNVKLQLEKEQQLQNLQIFKQQSTQCQKFFNFHFICRKRQVCFNFSTSFLLLFIKYIDRKEDDLCRSTNQPAIQPTIQWIAVWIVVKKTIEEYWEEEIYYFLRKLWKAEIYMFTFGFSTSLEEESFCIIKDYIGCFLFVPTKLVGRRIYSFL